MSTAYCGVMRSRLAAEHVAGASAAIADLTCPANDPLKCRGIEAPGTEVAMPDGSPGPGLSLTDEELERFVQDLAHRCDLNADSTFELDRQASSRVAVSMTSVQLYRLVGLRDPELARVFAGVLMAATRFNEYIQSRDGEQPHGVT